MTMVEGNQAFSALQKRDEAVIALLHAFLDRYPTHASRDRLTLAHDDYEDALEVLFSAHANCLKYIDGVGDA